MEECKLTAPVAFMVFNRLDCVQQVFPKIREAKPEKLFIVSDGPRESRPGEDEKVNAVRAYIEENIDWDCQVYKNYAESNMGCKNRIYSGISWVLEQEDRVIIVEDDCKPSSDFFEFCQEMLEIYKDEEKVWMISGLNMYRKQKTDEPYVFSKFPEIWGWATWQRAWKKIDIEVETWNNVRKSGKVKYAFDFWSYRCYKRIMDYQLNQHRDTWDIPWLYTILKEHGVGVVPRENLVANVGCGHVDASNTTDEVDFDFSYGKKMEFPLKKQEVIEADEVLDKECLRMRLGFNKEWNYIKYKFSRIIPKIKEKLKR